MIIPKHEKKNLHKRKSRFEIFILRISFKYTLVKKVIAYRTFSLYIEPYVHALCYLLKVELKKQEMSTW